MGSTELCDSLIDPIDEKQNFRDGMTCQGHHSGRLCLESTSGLLALILFHDSESLLVTFGCMVI